MNHANSQGLENEEEIPPSIPTPEAPISDANAPEPKQVAESDFSEIVRQHGGKLVQGEPPSAHWLRENIGIRKIENTGSSDDDIPFCLYTYGMREPDVCFDRDTQEEVYKRGMDKSILEELKRKYKEEGLMK